MRMLYAICSMLLMARFAQAAMTAQEKIDTLAAHNRYRAEVKPSASNMLQMQWSNALEKTAQDYANTCNFNHNDARTTQTRTNGGTFNYVGENLYIGSGARTGMAATLSWNNENSSYTYSTGACSGVCGHYTQNVWANSGFLGCASTFCPSAVGASFCSQYGGCTIVVCNYGEGGNYVGQKPYLQGTPCSACPASASACVNGLCTAGTATTPAPTSTNTPVPTKAPTKAPTTATLAPTKTPTKAPTNAPTTAGTTPAPTKAPTKAPTTVGTLAPTKTPTKAPTKTPTKAPTKTPTKAPTKAPTIAGTPAPTTAGGLVLNAAEKTATLDRHNLFRGEVKPTATNMLQLRWNSALEKTAQDYANTCNWNHNGARSTQTKTNGGTFNYVGENLYLRTGRASNAGVTAVNSWNAENASFTYPTTCASGQVCGHYTQNVWANTGFIGCAVAYCPSVANLNSFNCASYGGCTIVVCNYGEGGNYVGQAPYKTGTTKCSACPSTAPYCTPNGLCTATQPVTPASAPATASNTVIAGSVAGVTLVAAGAAGMIFYRRRRYTRTEVAAVRL